MNYKTYCEQRLKDLDRISTIMGPEDKGMAIARASLVANMTDLPLITTIKTKMEIYFGHSIENAEVDIWLMMCALTPALTEEMDVVQEMKRITTIGQKLISDLGM